MEESQGLCLGIVLFPYRVVYGISITIRSRLYPYILRSIYLQVPTSPIFSVMQHSPDMALVARVPEPLGLLLVPNLLSQVLMLSVQ